MSELSLNKFRCKSVIFQNALFAYLTTVKIELVTNDQSNDILFFFLYICETVRVSAFYGVLIDIDFPNRKSIIKYLIYPSMFYLLCIVYSIICTP